ncbi:DUF1844 domain-containing protein [Desulfobaculum bizertense]|uniref:DUF1844 domain-containing protein n=1 Tax=Desulfobaculum bizertense DSM 18034 TaxID=1121442 RepID=A0A1T4X0Z4_9BACT|nr:DUF1844 domain-containing protein [Desulfobaculum bizertense]UIJ37184.1 DUF1844 domain-containing protein [Desulfobaculum bizertense]SKA83226.1 protein of unknown function [Desulfobaculum bizertense DSM 18034]
MSEEKTAQNSCGASGSSMPEVTFSTFIMSLASSALVQLGEVPEPSTGKTEMDLVLAKHSIDVLSMLQEKTSGCLTEEEKQMLDGLLYEVRMKYILKSK